MVEEFAKTFDSKVGQAGGIYVVRAAQCHIPADTVTIDNGTDTLVTVPTSS